MTAAQAEFVQLQVLGPIHVTRGRGDTTHSLVTQPRRLAVLAYLAVARPRGLHSRDTLIALLWPESDQRAGRHALRNALHTARQALGESAIVTAGDGLVGIDHQLVRCDAVAMESAVDQGDWQRALDAYQGEFLQGFHVSDAPEFERWLEAERRRLHAMVSDAAAALVEERRATGDHAGALAAARRGLELLPDSEAAMRRVLELSRVVGDRAAAVRTYDDFTRRMRDDLDVEPSAETQRLARALREELERCILADEGAGVLPVRAASARDAQPLDDEQAAAALDGEAVRALGQRRRAAPLTLAVVALVLLAGGAWAWRTRRGAAPDAPLQVAVLPFETASESAGAAPDTAFANGLGDAISGKLAHLQGLLVIDRADVRSVDGAAAHPEAAGQTLHADYVLRATLRWATGADGQRRVQVSPVLVRVADGTTKWAGEPTVITPSDPFAAQGAIATAVAEALDVALAPAERARLARPPTADTVAFAAMERGRRMGLGRNQEERVRILREYERAYQRDPQYADAFGMAAATLLFMAHRGGAPPAFFDSAAVLARRALALDPGQVDALEALGLSELARGRVDDKPPFIERMEQAALAFPSSPRLLQLLAAVRLQTTGDSAGAFDAVTRGVALAPRSPEQAFYAMYTMIELRHYDDARVLIARARALEPEHLRVQLMAADLATAVGDTAGVSAAMRALHAGGWGANMLNQRRSGDAALRQELAAVSLASAGATTADDSDTYYRAKAQLFLSRGDAARARVLVDSGYRLAAAHEATLAAGSSDAASWWRKVAWYAAARGDRAAAVAALKRGAADPALPGHSGNGNDADQTCTSAEVYGLLGDAETMLPLLRRCLTMPNGYHLAQLGEPAFARLRSDPRVRALTAGLVAVQARARSTPVRGAS